MINIIISSLLFIGFILITRTSFYIIDLFKSIQKPKFLYFKQITFELLVSTVVLIIFVSLTFVVNYVLIFINFINRQ